MTEAEAIAKIHSVYPTGKKNGVENMRALMARLGNVQSAVPCVHVAGTNGKGSCCAMIERVLREAGYKTGLYTSPYIERYNERIRINGAPVSGEKLAQLVERVWPVYEACDRDGVHITEFEIGTALAFCAFAAEKVDVAIIEVGLGGRLDPTNIIHPLVSVITEVGMDHMQYLGNTIGEIALEKAGIMKRGVPVALGPQEKAAGGVLLAAAKGLGCEVIDPDAENVRETRQDVTFDVRLPGGMMKNLTVSLRGRHQAENACAALGAVEALKKRGFRIPPEAVRRGMGAVRWPGRLEYFGNVILDGAHNDPGVRALCRYCDDWLPKEKTVLLSGM
ncbi:MAG: bifunctional folylpolyglutamate synthase/dihydrofolate synthase, partial [Clostridia bacterium]|nr:bifunctional folylpolyglutamate synthase/dihydrofolate synthase [Clostridia bacterium]